jgi:hypothetical protein
MIFWGILNGTFTLERTGSMQSDHSRLCPRCRRPMVDISELLDGGEADGDWNDYSEAQTDWDAPLGGEAYREKIWECPECGYREYET